MLHGRVFRLFVSSTFSDFIAERAALQKSVFPELEAFCRERGATFQAVDLRWVSISVENFPGNSVQKFPVDCLPGSYGLCRLGWNRSTGVLRPKSAVSRVQSL